MLALGALGGSWSGLALFSVSVSGEAAGNTTDAADFIDSLLLFFAEKLPQCYDFYLMEEAHLKDPNA